MTYQDEISNRYFEWIVDLVGNGESYRRLLTRLHQIEFIFLIPKDENRAKDGIDLRYRFALDSRMMDAEDYLDEPCSVLEMMVALAIRCEHIMADPAKGDRTAQWFWEMVSNLGLGGQYDSNYNEWLINDCITRFLEREYDRDGKGGLFRIRRWNRDAREAEIWHQLMAYLNTLG